MLKRQYPEHDMNNVFDFFSDCLECGDCADNALDEMSFLNRLFAALPADAVEYAMRFLHGEKNLPSSCDEILPLFMRFVNLANYCELIEELRAIPLSCEPEIIKRRSEINEQLDSFEKGFCKPVLGFTYNKNHPDEKIDEASLKTSMASSSTDASSNGSSLHLMVSSCTVFPCEDVLKTSLFYETHCGFSSVHLDDEKMPHIRLCRDNIEIILAQTAGGAIKPSREQYGILYDYYIYTNEPLLLQNELEGNGVKIIRHLPDINEKTNNLVNRDFVFEDCDKRHICVSQRIGD